MRRKVKANPDPMEAMGETAELGESQPSSDPGGNLNGDAEARIRQRAYDIFQQRASNGTPGDGVSDWLEAERQIAAEQERPGGRRPSATG